MRAWLLLALGLALAGCELEDPCGEYVDYMCDCHPDEVDCEELERVYASPDPALRQECAVALAEQEDQDFEDGVECF